MKAQNQLHDNYRVLIMGIAIGVIEFSLSYHLPDREYLNVDPESKCIHFFSNLVNYELDDADLRCEGTSGAGLLSCFG